MRGRDSRPVQFRCGGCGTIPTRPKQGREHCDSPEKEWPQPPWGQGLCWQPLRLMCPVNASLAMTHRHFGQFRNTRQLPPIASSREQSCLARSRVDSATRIRYQGAAPLPAIRLLMIMGGLSPSTGWNRF